MYTDVQGKYYGSKFGKLISDEGLSANIFAKETRAYKVFNENYDKSEVFDEAFIMSKVEKEKIPAPHVYGIYQEGSHWVIEMDYIKGEDMMTRIIKAVENKDEASLNIELNKFAALQYRIHSTSGIELVDFKESMYNFILNSPFLSDDQKTKLPHYLEKLPLGDKLIHGDYHFFNILYDENDNISIIDWATAACGLPAVDVARTFLNLSFPPVPALKETWVQLNKRYVEAYFKLSNMKFSEIEEWFPVVAALSVGRDPVFTEHMQQYLNI